LVCEGERPSQEEIETAAARRRKHYEALLLRGDGIWERTHDYRQVTDEMRRAALFLGADRDWAYKVVAMVDCPYCGEKIREGVVSCRHCHAILDIEKALKGGLITPEQAAAMGSEKPRGDPLGEDEEEPVAAGKSPQKGRGKGK